MTTRFPPQTWRAGFGVKLYTAHASLSRVIRSHSGGFAQIEQPGPREKRQVLQFIGTVIERGKWKKKVRGQTPAQHEQPA